MILPLWTQLLSGSKVKAPLLKLHNLHLIEVESTALLFSFLIKLHASQYPLNNKMNQNFKMKFIQL